MKREKVILFSQTFLLSMFFVSNLVLACSLESCLICSVVSSVVGVSSPPVDVVVSLVVVDTSAFLYQWFQVLCYLLKNILVDQKTPPAVFRSVAPIFYQSSALLYSSLGTAMAMVKTLAS